MSDLLSRALPVYGLSSDTPLTLLNRSENETWRAGDLILRLHRQGYHTRDEIASELAWLGALQGMPGLNVVRPVAGRAGLVTEIGGRHIVAFAPIGVAAR
jgi:Ser/Thr protein kinase RdoA (MazF antagonist)